MSRDSAPGDCHSALLGIAQPEAARGLKLGLDVFLYHFRPIASLEMAARCATMNSRPYERLDSTKIDSTRRKALDV